MIELGTVVRDKVTGFTGTAENRATFMYGCDRYCVQPKIGDDGKIPESVMIDEPQLEVIEPLECTMLPIYPKPQLVELGQVVRDPVSGLSGTCIGRAVYLNGCTRICVAPKQTDYKKDESWWVAEEQVESTSKFTKKVTPDARTGGPAPSNSKY